jgi:DNA-binding transcriptional ArsR family regulator
MHGEKFSDKFRSKNGPKPKAARERVPKQQKRFAMITESDVDTLLELDHVCWPLLSILRIESIRHHGRPLILPTDALVTIKGLSRRHLRRHLRQLEGCGLISIQRRPSDPPIIKVAK